MIKISQFSNWQYSWPRNDTKNGQQNEQSSLQWCLPVNANPQPHKIIFTKSQSQYWKFGTLQQSPRLMFKLKWVAVLCLLTQTFCHSHETERENRESFVTTTSVGSPQVHAFFYLWYGNPETDGQYLHWDHEVLPHWSPSVRSRFPHGQRHAADKGEIHAPYFPSRGTYSSNDPTTLDSQMEELKAAGVTSVVLSWWGQASREGTSDTQGKKPPNPAWSSQYLHVLFFTVFWFESVLAFEYILSFVFILALSRSPNWSHNSARDRCCGESQPPYVGCSHGTLSRSQCEHCSGRRELPHKFVGVHFGLLSWLLASQRWCMPFLSRYGKSPAWLCIDERRVFYVYDSYHIYPADWAAVLKPRSDNGMAESFFIALWLNSDGGTLVSSEIRLSHISCVTVCFEDCCWIRNVLCKGVAWWIWRCVHLFCQWWICVRLDNQ